MKSIGKAFLKGIEFIKKAVLLCKVAVFIMPLMYNVPEWSGNKSGCKGLILSSISYLVHEIQDF